jgi:hypothetical protein
MPILTPTLNLPQSSLSAASSAKPAAAAPASAVAPAPAPKAPDVPSATVTLSPQALSAMAAESHVGTPASTTPTATPAAHDSSLYESLKMGIASAATDVGDAIETGAHAVVEGVETTLSTAHKVAKGMLELPFAVVAKTCDAAGAIIDAV